MRTRASASTLAYLLASHLAAETVATPPDNAPSLFPRAVLGNGFLSIPVDGWRRSRSDGDKRKRAGEAIGVSLDNLQVFYSIEVGLGTPSQDVTVLIDTGSSELWVNPDCSTARTPSLAKQCKGFGQYNPSKSKTPPVGPFGGESIRYGDVSDPSTVTTVDVSYYLDNVSLGGAKIKNQTFGVVTSSTGQAQGILGLAPDVQAGFDGTQPYSLLLNSMAQQGIINSRAFSLDLRHANSEVGAIIYGGVDLSKFVGPLTKRPLVPGSQGETRLAVNVDSIGLTLDGDSASFQLSPQDAGFMLDSGTTLSRVHPAAALAIISALGAQDNGDGVYFVDCGMRNAQSSSVNFAFGNTTIRVPFSDFVFAEGTPRDSDPCPLGLVVTTDQQILGDTVLRAGYFVFDWDNREVHLAQAANCGDSDIVTIGSGVNSVPAVEGNCNADGSVKTANGGSSTSAAAATAAAATKSRAPEPKKNASARSEPGLLWIGASTLLASTMGLWLVQLAW